jgi:hypothetical protein
LLSKNNACVAQNRHYFAQYPYVDFDVERSTYYAKQVNPGIRTIYLSSTKGDNFSVWTDWLAGRVKSEAYVEVLI